MWIMSAGRWAMGRSGWNGVYPPRAVLGIMPRLHVGLTVLDAPEAGVTRAVVRRVVVACRRKISAAVFVGTQEGSAPAHLGALSGAVVSQVGLLGTGRMNLWTRE